MLLPRAMLTAACLASGLTGVPSPAHATDGYCVLPDNSDPPGPGDTYLTAPGPQPAWVHPNPGPAAREPTPEQRLEFAGFPNVAGFDVLGPGGVPAVKLIATFSTNIDKVATLTSGAAVSSDGGRTFGPMTGTPLREPPIELRDGRLFATEYYLRRTGPHTARLGVLTADPHETGGARGAGGSREAGDSDEAAGSSQAADVLDSAEGWVHATATLTTPGELAGGGAAHGRPIQLADGTILITAYAQYRNPDPRLPGTFQAELYASADGGRTFTRRGVIAPPDQGRPFNEAAVAQVADGSLLAVLRGEGGRYATLHQSRSHDGGRTWTPVRPLRFAGQDCVVRGVAPRLLLMPNGVLVLSAGRPDNWLAISPDGIGESWRQQRVSYHNRDGRYDAHGSSGYTGIAAVGRDRLIQVFDNCKLPGVGPDGELNESACPDHGRFEEGGWYAIKRRLFTVVDPYPGARLDLAALHRRGELRIDTDLRWTSAKRPRSRPEAAFDGSTGYWSSAVAAGRGTYVLRFDRPQDLTRIGLSLRPGHPASAKVYLAGRNGRWGRPVLTVRDRADYALRYTPLTGRTRQIKIVTLPTAGCEAEIGRSCSLLNEIELYSD
ncbi:exo-alpha-sialidase [Nonomuraea sp. NN258]|uniref:sialidase family protein n=1 Tax=Nonomuraea antri TaxID=2730852 RepID=UPI001569B17E|nr:sialidase family protein [Nonomuraea antri]NRQ39515.1 exo-alpha-sialidase [Nonomuraea antri]